MSIRVECDGHCAVAFDQKEPNRAVFRVLQDGQPPQDFCKVCAGQFLENMSNVHPMPRFTVVGVTEVVERFTAFAWSEGVDGL